MFGVLDGDEVVHLGVSTEANAVLRVAGEAVINLHRSGRLFGVYRVLAPQFEPTAVENEVAAPGLDQHRAAVARLLRLTRPFVEITVLNQAARSVRR